MTLRTFTTTEKLAVVERLIEERRDSRRGPEADRYEGDVLRSLAKDLRGRMNGAPSAALVEIEARVVSVQRKRSSVTRHYDVDSLIGLAEQVIGRWPTIKQALEKFKGEGEG